MYNFNNMYTYSDTKKTKTHKYLSDALLELLKNQNFNQISVTEICNQALVSRSGFYSHFEDKYHLLLYTLKNVVEKKIPQLTLKMTY